METVIYAFVALLAGYLYIDKFLFKGQLGRLFLQGCMEFFFKRTASDSTPPEKVSEVPGTTGPGEIVSSTESLVVEKRYGECHEVPDSAKLPKTESKEDGSGIFTSETGSENLSEAFEWRAPSFPRQQMTVPSRNELTLRWEDADFAARFIQRDDESGEVDLIEIPDMEQLRREIALKLESIQDEEMRREMEPTDEERYGLDDFDTGAYT